MHVYKKRRQAISAVLIAVVLVSTLIGSGTSLVQAQEEIDPGQGIPGGNVHDPIPPGSTPVLGVDPLRRFALAGPDAAKAIVTEVEVADPPDPGQPFSYALRIETTAETTSTNRITLVAPTVTSIGGGDTLFMRWYVRTIATEAVDGRGRAQLTIPAAFSTLNFSGTVDEGWRVSLIPVPARLAYAAGAMTVTINIGGTKPQTIEIGGLEFVKYPRNSPNFVPTHQLPFSLTTYEGRALDAPWRVAAEERIEQYRKGDLRVVVTDERGTPIPEANVHVQMKRHQYKFGTAISGGALLPSIPNNNTVKYRDNLAQFFNAGGPENDLKWRGGWESASNRQRAINTVQWLRDRRMHARGHVLLWPSWNNSPTSLRTEYDNTLATQGLEAANTQLRQRILDHIRDEAGHPALKGGIAEWDVVNETNANNDFQRILGKSILVEAFQAAHEADPEAGLYLNENSVETLTSSKSTFYFNEVKYLVDNGAPISGIGMQGHVGAISIPSYLSNLDRFATFNLPIKITEFDIVTPNEVLQAEFTRDFLIATFSHPSTAGFQMWGFWDNAHWLSDAPLFYPDWTLKPSGRAYRDLIFKTWWTDTEGQTDEAGEYQTRGFLGDYEITANYQGASTTVSATLAHDGTTVTMVLPIEAKPIDVTGEVQAVSSGLFYSRATDTYNGTITLTNTGSRLIAGSLQIVFRDLPERVTLVNRSGTHLNNPYLTAPDVAFAPGESVEVEVRFSNPSNGQINYELTIYSGIF